MRLPFFCFNPGPRGLAMIQNSRILSKRSGDNTNNGRETNRQHIAVRIRLTPPEGRASTPALLASFLLALARRAAVEEVRVYVFRDRFRPSMAPFTSALRK